MLYDMRINYNDIVPFYEETLDYCGKNSSSFSLITNLKKPYAKIPPNCEHDDILKVFELYLLKQTIGLKKWPGTIKHTLDPHKVMNNYRSCKQTRKLLMTLPNIFLSVQNHLPEDICFYRKEKPWFVTVSHEKLAFIYFPSKDDISFLQEHKIRFYS